MINKLHYDATVCPYCGANLVGAEIPEEDREVFSGAKNYSRLIGIYDMEQDRTVAWQCPDCRERDKR